MYDSQMRKTSDISDPQGHACRSDSVPSTLGTVTCSEIWRRLEQVVALRGYATVGHWATSAGLSRTNVYRLKKPELVPTVKLGTLAQLADEAGIRLAWLVSGEGAMLASSTECPARDVALSAAAMILDDLPSRVIDEICSMPANARSARWWFAQIEASLIEEFEASQRA
jgi:DNA-binding phage protein